MDGLADFEKATRRLESAQVRAGRPDWLGEVRKLVDAIRVTPWRTPQERSEAQKLVIRLEKLTWRAGCKQPPPGPARREQDRR
jgi:hypothetical protein